jgi:hypothetical protein
MQISIILVHANSPTYLLNPMLQSHVCVRARNPTLMLSRSKHQSLELNSDHILIVS